VYSHILNLFKSDLNVLVKLNMYTPQKSTTKRV